MQPADTLRFALNDRIQDAEVAPTHVPLALLGPAMTLTSLGVDNNLYVQIGLMLLIALSAKNGILIVEVARELRIIDKKPILEAAVDAARTRFRPILMTSFAFILGVFPLVISTGAGAASRISLGIAVFAGMLMTYPLVLLHVSPPTRSRP